MSKIVQAVGVCSLSENREVAKRIEAAMSQAVLDCAASGITDPDKVRERMLQYREAAKAGRNV